jgi:MFS family permease
MAWKFFLAIFFFSEKTMNRPPLSVRTTYFLFVFFLDFGLAWCSTTVIPGLQRLGITMGEIGLMESLFWSFVLVTQIPSGLYADRVSRVRALGLSSIVLAMGGAIYMCAVGFKTALMGELTLGIGLSIGDNALRSWITHAVQKEEENPIRQERALTRLFGTSQILRSLVALASGTLGGLAPNPPQWAIWFPLAFTSTCNTILVFTVMKQHDPPNKNRGACPKKTLREGIKHLFTHPALFWATAAATIIGMLVPYFNYWTLYFRASVGEGSMSFMWICSFVPITLGGWIVRRFGHGRLSEAGAIIASVACAGVSLAILAQVESIPVQMGSLIVLQLGRGTFQPYFDLFLAKRVHDEVRTTVYALVSTLSKVACVSFPMLVYMLSAGYPDGVPLIRIVWMATSSCMIVSLLTLWLFRPRNSHR